MISIIIIYFLSKKIGNIALAKGEKPLTWKIFLVVAWMLGELIGSMIVMYFFGFDLLLISLFGAGMGMIGYYLVKQKIEELPDVKQ